MHTYVYMHTYITYMYRDILYTLCVFIYKYI